MNRDTLHTLLLLPLIGLLTLTSIPLRSQNVLKANPNAVQLQKVWEVRGDAILFEEIGYNVWGGVDINGDDTADFAQYKRSEWRWYYYAGGKNLSTDPIWVSDSVGSTLPYIKDFYGDGRQSVLYLNGYQEVVDEATRYYEIMQLHEFTSAGINRTPFLTVDHGKKVPPVERFLEDILVSDVNNDGIDDVIVVLGGLRVGYRRDTGIDRSNQVWIYYGGPDFQLEEPDVIVKDTSQFGEADAWQVWFEDFDGDHKFDLAFGGNYPQGGYMLRFFWGDNNSPASWSQRPADRNLPLVSGVTGINSTLNLGFYHLDGDAAADIAGYGGGTIDGTSVYLSTRGNVRTRSFSIDSADLFYKTGLFDYRVGSLNDTAYRYDMLPLAEPLRPGEKPTMLLVSGSAYGPDYDYEAWYSPALDHLNVIVMRPAGDVTGDGYGDFIIGDYGWPGGITAGVAVVVAGGPSIPLDDTTLSVQEYPIAGESGGLYVWPNPVIDELHIAWRGNLAKKPAWFAAYDMSGREVVRGEVNSSIGAALWECRDIPSGAYRVVAFDGGGEVIGTAPIIKQ